MILYGSLTSPFVRHCRIALMQSGLAWSFEATDYATSAKLSPTKRVPLLADGEQHFTDSSSIIHHVRSRSGQDFLPTANDTERYALVNTVLDTAINLFLLEKDGLTATDAPYLQRQTERIQTSLAALAEQSWAHQAPFDDASIRLGCLLDWAAYRGRFSIEPWPELQAFMANIQSWDVFTETAPPKV